MFDANQWLEENYPKDDVCKINDFYSKGKRRNEITKLTSLGRRNLVGTLDLSDFINLEKLNCSNNQLTELILLNSYRLEWLYCSNNQLTDLSLTNLLQFERN